MNETPQPKFRITVKPGRRWWRTEKWKFALTSINGEPIDPRDTYANVGDIRDVFARFKSEPVEFAVFYDDGHIEREILQ